MHFGLALDFGTQRASLDRVVDEFVPALRLAERYGFDAVFAGESFPSGPGFFHLPSPFLVLANLAPRTFLRLGTGVTLLPGWHPLKLAYECAVLDQFSGGRFILGIGVANPRDWRRFGQDRAKANAGKRLEETLRALKALWTGEPGFHGELIAINQGILPLPLQSGGPPILVGGLVPQAARRAAVLGDGWYAATPYRLTDIKTQIGRYRQALLDSGRDPQSGTVAANRLTFVAETEDGLAAGHPYVTRILASYARMGGLLGSDRGPGDVPERLDPNAPDLLDRAAPEVCLIGTPEAVTAQITRYAEVGVTHIQMRVAPGDMPAELVAQTITLVGERVLPRFQ